MNYESKQEYRSWFLSYSKRKSKTCKPTKNTVIHHRIEITKRKKFALIYGEKYSWVVYESSPQKREIGIFFSKDTNIRK